uniref:Uncharacterized protein n=1 Tax=viral metagenome TaxID=1070528 RepID=A0A6C0EIX4_9ZZZZ
MYTLEIIIILLTFNIEYNNKNIGVNSPLFSIPQEFITLYIAFEAYRTRKNKYKYIAFTGFSLHFSRIILNNKQLLSIPMKYQIIGLFSTILLFNKDFFFIDSFVRNYIIQQIFKINGFNKVIDIPITLALFSVKFSKKQILTKLEKNYLNSDILYHLIEIVSQITATTSRPHLLLLNFKKKLRKTNFRRSFGTMIKKKCFN